MRGQAGQIKKLDSTPKGERRMVLLRGNLDIDELGFLECPDYLEAFDILRRKWQEFGQARETVNVQFERFNGGLYGWLDC